METVIVGILKSLSEETFTLEAALVSLLILLALYAYKHFIKPLTKSLKNVDDNLIKREEVTEIQNKIDSTISKLDRLIERNAHVDETTSNLERDAQVLKRDLEQVKGILNQFQGHMLYGRRSSDFENQELR